MPIARNERGIQLALQAMEHDKKLSLYEAAKLYLMAPMILYEQHKGIHSCTDTIANSRNLDPIEEQVIV